MLQREQLLEWQQLRRGRRLWWRLRRRKLSLFVAAYVAAVLAGVAVGVRIKQVRGADRREPLSPEEIGFLTGGPVRAAEVAVTALISEHRAKFDGDRLVADEPGAVDSPIGTAVREQLGGRLDDIIARTANSQAVQRLGGRLLAGGMLVAPRTRLRRAIIATLPLLLLAGLLTAWNEWTPWTVGAGVLTLAGIVGLLVTPPPVLTTSGSRALLAATAGLAPVDPAELTARYGLRRPKAPAPPRRREVVQTAVFDGHTVERIEADDASNQTLPRLRRGATVLDEPVYRIRPVWAAGWFAGGWLAGELLSEVGDGDFIDTGFFDGFGDA
ncbi:hypothetical protein Lesp02_45710 [Lentzea sp. NBRC 105346]|uniref:TIGR04222 domain-containing membrane protein n=1 Tax=Lentzea sp. NBRC 105346 TaxID=3032205 RepID=UPI0024A07D86|nr:TIGR04222 domain-containing membrane protein [Lentzea sp. NBRC 105346]GLZ32383.1 hypothetical protein Lesp02_45710 [Lentzea sp. NBRC 105346]